MLCPKLENFSSLFAFSAFVLEVECYVFPMTNQVVMRLRCRCGEWHSVDVSGSIDASELAVDGPQLCVIRSITAEQAHALLMRCHSVKQLPATIAA
jgi:hypothetical protein